jgi:predicted nucleotidyltransferase
MGTKGAAPKNLLGEALFGETRQRVLALFFGHPDERFYQRRVIQTVGLGSGTVQRDLQRLTRAGVLTRTVEGRQVYFQANGQCPVFEELRALVRKTFGVAHVLKHALASMAGRVHLAFIFGSIAGGTETSASDVDVLIVGDDISLADVVSAIAEAQRDLEREINPSVYLTGEFCRKLAEGQHFLSAIAAGQKIFLIGDERDLTRLAQIRMAQRTQPKPAGNRRSVRRR